jgi:outer membrane receptor protein involved in Fe transport
MRPSCCTAQSKRIERLAGERKNPRRFVGALLSGCPPMTMSGAAGRRFTLFVMAAALAVLFTAPVPAAEAARKRYTLSAGDAAVTLKRFSEQSGEQIVYPVDQVRGIRTQAVRGEFTASEALERMLAGTELRVVRDATTGALGISRVPRPPAAPTVTARSVRAAAPAGDPLDIVRLNPFEVRATPDNSYGALDSNSLTAFRIDLNKLPVTTSIFSRLFIDDVAATTIEDVLVNYSGVVGPSPGNPAAALDMPGDRDGAQGLGIRGLSASGIKRDGFIGVRNGARTSTGLTDVFSTDRIEIIEGPQALLYGAVGGGGVVNIVSKRALFDLRRNSLRYSIDRYGSKRLTADFMVGGEKVAVRVAAFGEDSRNFRVNLGTDSYGFYTQFAFRLGKSATLRLFRETTSNWANVAFTPNLNNFFAPDDPRRGKDARYLALTGQLSDVNIVPGGVDYTNISSFGSWWSSERIENRYNGLTLESLLPHGFSAQLTAIYSETSDARYTTGKALLPVGAAGNSFDTTAVQMTAPTDNWQSDRTKGVRLTLLHGADFLRGRAHSQTALGFEASRQGPAFASSGIDYRYYQADANWNAIVDPARTSDYGRIGLPALVYPLSPGVPERPLFRPGTDRITLNGINYVRQPRIASVPALASPGNPYGLVPNNPTPANPNGFSGNWNRGGETRDYLAYLSNFTDWFDGRFTTLAGLSVNRFATENYTPGGAPTILPMRSYPGYEIGFNYRLTPELRVYTMLGTAGLAAGTTKDLHGNPLKVPKAHSPTPEIGLIYQTTDHRFSARFTYAFNTRVENETKNTGDRSFQNAVNPAGINGTLGTPDQWVNLDRTANSLGLVATADPSPRWRMRFSATKLDGTIDRTVRYPQLYNDQFFTSGGVVTYRDGAPVLVDPSAGAGPKTAALTLAMINDPSGPYYASPDADSGSITNPTLRSALTAVDPVHGSAATGATGLPISDIQYAFANPHGGAITLYEAGEKNTGFNEFTVNFQNHYTFDSGRLKGAGVFLDARTYFHNRAYYTSYFSTSNTTALRATRELYRLPTSTVFGLGLSYRRELRHHLSWTTQLNINNALNHYRVWVIPSASNGANFVARLSTQPRQFIWSNTFEF